MRRLHRSFTRYIYWPLVQKLKGEYTAGALKELAQSQWKSREELLAGQWQLVRRTVNKAIREVPYYRKVCADIGWDAANRLFSYDDFLKFPKLEKESLRDNVKEFLNPNYTGRVTVGRTSGSTGHSLTLYYNTEHESYSEAGRWRAKQWWGIQPGSAHVSIWGRPFTGLKDQLNQKIKSFLMHNLFFSAFELHDEALGQIWQKISRFRPAIIYCYPTAIYPLAVYLKQNKMQAEQLGVKVIMVTAESITAQQRALIEDVFGCKTANEYGCSETGGFVYECPFGSWHISSELAFVEFLDQDGNPVDSGQTGEIFFTHLRNDYMPLIRYRVGDQGGPIAKVCDCGRGLPLMNVSVAKESDIFQLDGGRTFSSEIFDYINLAVSKACPSSILQFRVVQKAVKHFEVEMVVGNDSFENGVSLFKDLMAKQLGGNIRIDTKIVPYIAREPSGKLRYFVSEVNL